MVNICPFFQNCLLWPNLFLTHSLGENILSVIIASIDLKAKDMTLNIIFGGAHQAVGI